MASHPFPNGSPDAEPPRPTFQRTNSTPPQASSKEAFTSTRRTSSASVMPLKKRPSAFSLQNTLTPIPPSLPSPAFTPRLSQSPCSPSAMPDSPPPVPRRPSSRPSTASSREEVTPWEFQSNAFERTLASPTDGEFARAPTPTQKSKPSSIKSRPPSVKSAHQPSLRSRSSSTATGLVEDVTPWELYPPIPEKNTKYHLPNQTIPEQTVPSTSLPPMTTTGFVEDVTPWELVPPPQQNIVKSTPRTPSQLASVDETSTFVSYDSARPQHSHARSSTGPPSIQHSHVSGASSQEHKVQKTGPTEDVTPWELEPAPGSSPTLDDGDEMKESMSTQLRSSLTLAQVEEVTPWELHPAPSTPPPTETVMKEMSEGPQVNGGGTVKKKGSRSVSGS